MDRVVLWFLRWLVRWVGATTLFTLALLLAALGSVALGLAGLVDDLSAGLFLSLAAGGTLTGWILAKSSLPGWLAGPLALILGTGALLLHVGGLGGPLMEFLRATVDLIPGGVGWPQQGPPDVTPVAAALEALATEGGRLLARLADWLGGGGYDPLAPALTWGLGLWLTAVWAGWAVRRRDRALQGLTPAGVLLAVALSFTWRHPYALMLLLGLTWSLQALVVHVARERRWERLEMDFSPQLRVDLAMAVVGITMTLMTAALLMPSLSVRPVFRFTHRLVREHLRDGERVAASLGLEPGAGPTLSADPPRTGGLPRRHLLGAGPELSQEVVMVVYPEVSWEAPPPRPNYYWRSFTYDTYTGRGWLSGETETVTYRAGETATTLSLAARRRLRQEVRVIGGARGILYRAGELVTADRDFRVAWRPPDDVFGAQIDATAYRADSLLALPGQAQLRAAGTDYPDWVTARYLTLPDTVPERVLALAQDLTAAEPTPYDRARAIRSHLRTYTYTLDVAAPPPDRDVADYFLFDLQQGYCDYYATTMVVLARGAGLPARLVTGYASGTYDAPRERFIVTEADAHSWVEVYFPEYGWIEFEPTAGRPAIERPAQVAFDEASELPEALEPAARTGMPILRSLGLGLLGVALSLTLAGLAWWLVDGWRLRRAPPRATVSALYGRLYRHGRRLAVPVRAGDTPREFEAALTDRVTALARGKGTEAACRHVRWLSDLYVRTLYSPHAPTRSEQAQAIHKWRQLRRRLWLAWLRQRAERR